MTPSALVVPMLGQQPPVHFTGMTQPHNWPVFNPGSSGYTRSSRELRQTDFPNNVMPVQGGPPVRDTWGRYWWTPGNGGFFGWTHRSNGMRLFLPADLPDNQMDNRGVPGLGYRSHQDYLHWHPPSTQRSPPHASRGLPLTTPQPPLSTPQGERPHITQGIMQTHISFKDSRYSEVQLQVRFHTYLTYSMH